MLQKPLAEELTSAGFEEWNDGYGHYNLDTIENKNEAWEKFQEWMIDNMAIVALLDAGYNYRHCIRNINGEPIAIDLYWGKGATLVEVIDHPKDITYDKVKLHQELVNSIQFFGDAHPGFYAVITERDDHITSVEFIRFAYHVSYFYALWSKTLNTARIPIDDEGVALLEQLIKNQIEELHNPTTIRKQAEQFKLKQMIEARDSQERFEEQVKQHMGLQRELFEKDFASLLPALKESGIGYHPVVDASNGNVDLIGIKFTKWPNKECTMRCQYLQQLPMWATGENSTNWEMVGTEFTDSVCLWLFENLR